MISLLNIVLLSLSIATILLTLVSYLLYKFRQLPKYQTTDTGRKLEGVYFRRYLPADEVAATAAESAAQPLPARNARRWLPQSTTSFFGIVALAIFLSLLGQLVWNRMNSGELLSDRQRKELMAQGLLQNRKLGSLPLEKISEEYVFPEQKARLAALVEQLKGKQIWIVQTPANRAADLRKNTRGWDSWTKFLETNGIAYHRSNELPIGRQGIDLVILPHAVLLTARERGQISAALARGVSFLAAGPIAVGAGSIDNDAADWTSKTFGIHFFPNPTPTNRYPTLFRSDTVPWWDVPSGLDAEWFPTDGEYKAVAVTGDSGLFEGDYHGAFNGIEGYPRVTEVSRAQYVAHPKARAAWLALDPHNAKSDDGLKEAEVFYAQAVIAHSLAWVAGLPAASVTSWQQGRKGAMVVWVDTEDKFENIFAIADSFRQHRYPASFFVVSNLFRQNTEMLRHLSADMDIESHSENHQTFDRQPLELQFDRIQISRHEIEAISRRPVLGFRPPTEKSDPETISAVIQNGLKFFVGNQEFQRYAPAWIASGQLLFFPRTMYDDINFKHAGLLEEAGDFVSNVAAQADHVGELHGAYLLGLHTQLFGEGMPLQGLSQALEALESRRFWKTNFAELYQWTKDRLSVETTLERDEQTEAKAPRYRLVVSNRGDHAISNLAVAFDAGHRARFRLVDRPVAADTAGPRLEGEETPLLQVPRLEPKEIAVFELEEEG